VRAESAGSVTLAMTPFSAQGVPGAGTIDRIEIRRVGYVRIQQPSDASSIQSGSVPDPLEPTTFGASESVPALQNQPFWITVYVPETAAPGDYTATLTVRIGTAAQDVPIRLHVYGFALPRRIGFDGQWNASSKRPVSQAAGFLCDSHSGRTQGTESDPSFVEPLHPSWDRHGIAPSAA
jgi:hypothetical protein